MFSHTAEYALRAVVWLAQQSNEGPVGNQTIAEAVKVSPTYLAKVLQALAKAEIVTSRRGVGGGFVLNGEPSDYTVLDVINSVDKIRKYDNCPLNIESHRDVRCSLHANMNQAVEKVEELFSRHTIADLINDPTQPKPLVEIGCNGCAGDI